MPDFPASLLAKRVRVRAILAVDIAQNKQPHSRNSSRLIFWLVIFAAFAVTGLRGYRNAEDTPKVTGTGANACSDAILKQSISTDDGSQKLTDAFAQMPALRPVAIFCPPNKAGAIITSQFAGYLAWPRQVWPVTVNARIFDKTLADFSTPSFAAILFYSVKPRAPLPGERQIGPVLLLVPHEMPNP